MGWVVCFLLKLFTLLLIVRCFYFLVGIFLAFVLIILVFLILRICLRILAAFKILLFKHCYVIRISLLGFLKRNLCEVLISGFDFYALWLPLLILVWTFVMILLMFEIWRTINRMFFLLRNYQIHLNIHLFIFIFII